MRFDKYATWIFVCISNIIMVIYLKCSTSNIVCVGINLHWLLKHDSKGGCRPITLKTSIITAHYFSRVHMQDLNGEKNPNNKDFKKKIT